MRYGLALGALGGLAIIGAAGMAQRAAAPPTARYYMDASTTSGMMSGNPMAAMMGGGGAVGHTLLLRLGSSQAPTGGAPKADHFMPPAAGLGDSVPLETPVRTEGGAPEGYRRPSGRLLIFWGCGPHAGPGQPVVIDFAKVAAGQAPPGLFSTAVPMERGPTMDNSRTYGEWPNAQGRKQLSGRSSLIGDHRIEGDYSPPIKFALAQDFMPPLSARAAPAADGSVQLGWGPVDRATGYYAWAMGGRDMGGNGGDMVWWTSAARQEFGAGLWDWLSPATVSRLIGQKVVMPPDQTSCVIPAEAKQAAGEMMISFLYAYGPEADFAYPPRPADPRAPWRPDWTAKARFRSMTTIMPGMENMAAMRGGEDEGETQQQPDRKKPCKPSLGGMLSGMLRKTCR